MARARVLDNNKISVIFDGVLLENLYSGDSVVVTPNTNGSAMDPGLTGATTTFSGDKTGQVSITLQQSSPSWGRILRTYEAQRSGRGRLFAVQIIEASGAAINATGCSIADPGPSSSGALPTAGRTFVLNVERLDMPE